MGSLFDKYIPCVAPMNYVKEKEELLCKVNSRTFYAYITEYSEVLFMKI